MKILLALFAFSSFGAVNAAETALSVPMSFITDSGTGSVSGEIVVTQSAYGLIFTPALSGLSPGIHGFHLHENGSCNPGVKDGKPVAGLSAGGHFDPQKTGAHGSPYGDGHMGDLPPIYVDADGKAITPVLAPRLRSLDSLHGLSLMLHVGGDNHHDHPTAQGGGGTRMVCGVVK